MSIDLASSPMLKVCSLIFLSRQYVQYLLLVVIKVYVYVYVNLKSM